MRMKLRRSTSPRRPTPSSRTARSGSSVCKASPPFSTPRPPDVAELAWRGLWTVDNLRTWRGGQGPHVRWTRPMRAEVNGERRPDDRALLVAMPLTPPRGGARDLRANAAPRCCPRAARAISTTRSTACPCSSSPSRPATTRCPPPRGGRRSRGASSTRRATLCPTACPRPGSRSASPRRRQTSPTPTDRVARTTTRTTMTTRTTRRAAVVLRGARARARAPQRAWVFANELVPKQQRGGRTFVPRTPRLITVRRLSWHGQRPPRDPRASRSTSRAAFRPFAPVTPPPGCVPAPHRYSPRIGVR